jgi:hypothetical protein
MPTPVKERSIIFSPAMVRAILNGNKHQTRRVIKPQPLTHLAGVTFDQIYRGTSTARFSARASGCICVDEIDCKYGGIGDRLYVKETWSTLGLFDDAKPSELDPRGAASIRYFADGKRSGKLRPSIFMPRWASRITLEITDIRVQRVQDITEEDAKAEGIEQLSGPDGGIRYRNYWEKEAFFGSSFTWAVPSFAALWNSINGKKIGCDFQSNPYVWAISFRVLDADQKVQP